MFWTGFVIGGLSLFAAQATMTVLFLWWLHKHDVNVFEHSAVISEREAKR